MTAKEDIKSRNDPNQNEISFQKMVEDTDFLAHLSSDEAEAAKI